MAISDVERLDFQIVRFITLLGIDFLFLGGPFG